jgi:hypothetical protein
MNQKFECIKCHKHYKKLTKEDFCACCYQNKFGTWSKEFQEDKKK